MKRIGIIGAGRFGLSLAESLAEAGQEVLLLERNFHGTAPEPVGGVLVHDAVRPGGHLPPARAYGRYERYQFSANLLLDNTLEGGDEIVHLLPVQG